MYKPPLSHLIGMGGGGGGLWNIVSFHLIYAPIINLIQNAG